MTDSLRPFGPIEHQCRPELKRARGRWMATDEKQTYEAMVLLSAAYCDFMIDFTERKAIPYRWRESN